jgi:O-antigen/teichoic acid export membrane protein
MTLFFSFDTILVKYLFSPEVAGQYSGVSIIARVVLFLTGSFAVVLLSSVKVNGTHRENTDQLKKAMIVTSVLGGVTAIIFALFPSFVTHLLFGTRYDAMSYLLPALSFTMLFISLCTLLANFHIALRHYAVLMYVAVGVAVAAVLLIVQHDTVQAVVWSIFFGSIAMLASLIVYTVLSIFTNRKEAHVKA